MFSSRSVQIAAVFSDVFGQALPILCRSFYNETKAEMFFSVFAVALLAEGVDRNIASRLQDNKVLMVALLAEGVDRNAEQWSAGKVANVSPSSRRAWIEIPRRTSRCGHRCVALLAEGVDRNAAHPQTPLRGGLVALLAEGVDRNLSPMKHVSKFPMSPSSRRAWIEIIKK